MIPELVKAALAAYAVVGLVTIIAGGCKHHTGIDNAEKKTGAQETLQGVLRN